MTKQRTTFLPLILPALLVVTLYAWWHLVIGTTAAEDLALLRADLQNARASATRPEQVLARQRQLTELNEEVEELRAEQEALSSQGALLIGQAMDPLRKIALTESVVDVLRDHGLKVTGDKIQEQNRRQGLSRSLEETLDKLRDEVDSPAEPSTRRVTYALGQLPSEDDFLVGPTSRTARQAAHIRQLELWGRYDDVRAAIEQLSARGSEVAVLSLTMERPHTRDQSHGWLRWTMAYRLLPETVEVEPDDGLPPETSPPEWNRPEGRQPPAVVGAGRPVGR